jgi:hypothetical protein
MLASGLTRAAAAQRRRIPGSPSARSAGSVCVHASCQLASHARPRRPAGA